MSWERKLQGTPGAIGVLHTHSRCLDFHPHVHFVVPAAAIDATKKLWRTNAKKKSKKSYLFNHQALADVFRAKMLDSVTKAGFELPGYYPVKWVVNCKSVGAGDKALTYLGRYLYRGVIQEKDIVACQNGEVTYRFQNSDTKKMEYRTVSGANFLWLVLQHVLPRGLRRARNFGFLHPNSKRLINVIQLILKFDPSRALAWMKKRPLWLCSCCGATMKIIKTRLPPRASFPWPTTKKVEMRLC